MSALPTIAIRYRVLQACQQCRSRQWIASSVSFLQLIRWQIILSQGFQMGFLPEHNMNIHSTLRAANWHAYSRASGGW